MNAKKQWLIQFVKFGIVGAFNTLSSTIYYWILITIGLNYILSTTIAYFLSSIIGFFLNNKWVFKREYKKQSLFKYYVVYGTSYLLNVLCMYIWIDLLRISEYIAPLLTLFITVPYNFIFNKLWVFCDKREKNDE